jgi:D-amino peptidase
MLRSLASLVSILLLTGTVAAQDGLKVYISADMEGLTGAVTGEQLGPGGFEYGYFREVMTDEVLAAIEGARAAGATEILISDSHGNGQNLLLDRLPNDVMVVRSWPRPLMMMEGIDGTFDAAIFIGYHSGTTNPDGVRAHTMSSANLAGVSLNGVDHNEAGLNAAIAGHFGVPVVMVSGDDAAIAETRALLGDIEGAVVKRAISFHAATTMTPAAGRAVIREKVETALRRLDDFQPYVLAAPITLELTYKNYRPAQVAALMQGIHRAGAHSIRYTGASILEVARTLAFLTSYEAGLTP